MFPFSERRRQKLDQFFEQIEAAHDATLAAVLSRATPEEISVVLAIFSIERANRVLAHLPPERIAVALTLLDHGSKPPEDAVIRLAATVGREAAAEGPTTQGVPFCIRAIDMAGKVLGGK